MSRKDAPGQERRRRRGPRLAIARRGGEEVCVCYDDTAGLARKDDFLLRAHRRMGPRFVDVIAMCLGENPEKLTHNDIRAWGVRGKTVDAWQGPVRLEMAAWARMRRGGVNRLGGRRDTVHEKLQSTKENAARSKGKRGGGCDGCGGEKARRRKRGGGERAAEQGRFDESHLEILP